MGKQTHPRTPPDVVDGWRVRAVRGDRLDDLTDAQREWVWRSLLKGVRLAEMLACGGLSQQQYTRALPRIERWYKQRCLAYKAKQGQTPDVQVVRPVKPLPKRKRRGLWFFGQGG
ncbi:MAG: hypothetical protein H0X24_25070 [Ktedonobacterales bacterium]|nr:hypothetical protein [Ktedonobacterales bacterium]